jgi:signal transduction histidine kinase
LNLRRFIQIYAVAGLLALAVFWAFYSQRLLKQLEEETLFRSRLYASYIRSIASPESEMLLENLLFEEIVSQIDFPVVITDALGNPQSFRNVPDRDTTSEALPRFIQKLEREHEPIPIRAVVPVMDSSGRDTLKLDTLTLSILHYGLPKSWTMLQYFPLIQISFIVLFIILGFVFIFASARREQERLWVALARETAHQLGTPVSSLMGWSELIRPKLDKEASREITADLERIKGILDRFARIGDKPHLEPHEIEPLINETVDFMQRRAPSRIKISSEVKENIRLLIDPTLLSWTLENLIRNSISKKHGWGIGLALSRRVIERIHHGKLKVKSSKPGKTVLSILLRIWQE